MNPFGAVLFQSVGLTLAIVGSWLFGGDQFEVAVGVLLSALMLMGVLLALRYARDLRSVEAVERSRWRRRGDALVTLELVGPVVIARILALIDPAVPIESPGALELATVSLLIVVLLTAVFGSSLWDWWYVLPSRDGLVRLPPCMSSGDHHWLQITETWIRHRFVAESVFLLFFPVTSAVVTFEVWAAEPTNFQWIAKIVSPIALLLSLAFGISKLRLGVGARVIVDGPIFAVGDTLTWKTTPGDPWTTTKNIQLGLGTWKLTADLQKRARGESHQPIASAGKKLYVLDVSLERATMLRIARSPDGYNLKQRRGEPMRALTADGSIKDLRAVSYCLEQGACLRLHDHCERSAVTADGAP